ncbi:proline dehydrogenase family protein [Arthrobacter castelli]|uniref:proline dehydrogenase family protein n=1 Tax=Arthrobacter castelli TaxID=271431 RepID=UPI0004090E13|nr:bifunctional proline dehydrogenase/L-glutamate gamma-semialdehyde dehydrogenase [Arthrobacter castelli]
MTNSFEASEPRPADLADDVVSMVRRWLHLPDDMTAPEPVQLTSAKASRSAALLAEVLKDPAGLDFTLGFVDRVIRPEDLGVAAHELSRLAAEVPRFLPWYMRAAVKLGGLMGPAVPWLVVPIARRALRSMVEHLIVDARPHKLADSIATLQGDDDSGIRLNLNLLGEAVLGESEADARLEGTKQLLARDDVDYVSIKVSSVVSRLNMWAFDETVEMVAERLFPLYKMALEASTPKFINLDMEEYHDLDLTLAVFKRVLSRPELKNFESGIVLQAYLPDALGALQELTAWAKQRVADGGAGVKVRLVKGANLPMEHVDAAVHSWPLATYGTKQDTDTNYKRVLDWAFRPENMDGMRLGVAGHNLFDIAFARILSLRRGVADRVDYEMLLGMAEEQARQVRNEVGSLLLYTPVVHPKQFDVAISYLVRRLEENASGDNFMSAVFELTSEPTLFEREKERFLASLNHVDTLVPERNRQQDPQRALELGSGEFDNESNSDSSLPHIRQWGRQILDGVPGCTLGRQLVEESFLATNDDVDAAVSRALQAQPAWSARGAPARAEVLRAAARQLARQRAGLIQVAASEAGKTISETDPEVSEAVDFANYYALQAEELDNIGSAGSAGYDPVPLTVVTPPWNFPVAIPTGSMLAPLATGSAVIVKPAPQAKRCAAVIVEALWAAGVPKDVLIFADVDEGPVGEHLIANDAVGRVILTGGYETAKLFRSWRHDLPLLAETSGKNSMIVSPSADLDLAAEHVAKSAFGHAGQKCSAASLVILVGPAAQSSRFRNQLVDAVSSLRVGWPADPQTEMGPVIEPVGGKLEDALTTLGDGEWWAVEPKQLDESGRLWSPGVRAGVQPGSHFHLTEFFGPVLGVMTADTFEEAIELQNAPVYGLTAGLHTMDADELPVWLDRVQAGNLYINRGITGAIVRRQSFGGWKRSSVGPGAKAGGPNYLIHMVHWHRRPLPDDGHAAAGEAMTEVELVPAVADIMHAMLFSGQDQAFLARSVVSDQAAYDSTFGRSIDVTALGLERNEFRYLPTGVTIRLNQAGSLTDLVRVVLAAARSGAGFEVSTAQPLPQELAAALPQTCTDLTAETDEDFHRRAAAGRLGYSRVRLIGGGYSALCEATAGDPDLAVHDDEVTTAGRLELLPFLLEQAVSITAHRFGNPDRLSEKVLQD